MFPPQSLPTPQPGAGLTDPQKQPMMGMPQPDMGTDPNTSDAALLELWKRWKLECFSQRWIFERQWMRNVWYILNRQWIYFDSKRGQWQDKRLAKWVPRPVTNICKEAVQAVRANFAAIDYGTNARPNGEDNDSIITAGVADKYAPILHEEHKMNAVMNELDFWLLATGNVFLHTFAEKKRENGIVKNQFEQCQDCQQEALSSDIADAGQKCPSCGSPNFAPAVDPMTGQPKPPQEEFVAKGTALALSPFELAFPLIYERFDLVPYVVRMRWRDKNYYEQTEGLQQYATGRTALSFSKSPQERSMQIFKTLPFQNDLGIAPPYFGSGGANSDSEGIVEYDVWVKPCAQFPDGYVFRVAGDSNPVIIHAEQNESIPGPLPYKDAKQTPLWPFFHAQYDEVGGRALGSALIDPIIQIQDQINQIDSHCLMILGRMANPVWLEPKGAEVEKFTGQPGLVVKWNPLVAGGNAKPERIPGEGINPSIFQYREMKKKEAEELTGTYDILKGQKPAGVEAYAALDLLVQRGQARHASAMQSRAALYKGWFKIALELEREFGPDDRVRASMRPTREWAFDKFKKADLNGSVEILIEDGTMTPKTALGERAAIEHLRQLGLLNPSDPDQVMAIYEKFGQSRLLPGLDAQVQECWRNMDRFEKFFSDPQAQAKAQQAAMLAPPGSPVPGPLMWKRWYAPQIHRQELIKWCLSDRGRAVFEAAPKSEMMVDAYLQEIDLALMQQQAGMIDVGGEQLMPPGGPQQGGQPGQPGQQPPKQPGGAGAAMANSNRNAAGATPQSSGPANDQQQANDPAKLAAEARGMAYLEQHTGGR